MKNIAILVLQTRYNEIAVDNIMQLHHILSVDKRVGYLIGKNQRFLLCSLLFGLYSLDSLSIFTRNNARTRNIAVMIPTTPRGYAAAQPIAISSVAL